MKFERERFRGVRSLGRALGHSVVNMEYQRMITNVHHVGAVPRRGMQVNRTFPQSSCSLGLKPNSRSLGERKDFMPVFEL